MHDVGRKTSDELDGREAIMNIDLKVAQLLCSRVCHDLISPAGAINAGLELMAENPKGDIADAMALSSESARQLTAKLSFFRAAFGATSQAMTLDQLIGLGRGFVGQGGVRIDAPNAEGTSTVPAAGVRLALAIVMLGVGALPRGGALELRIAALPDGLGIALKASGKGAALKDDVKTALALPDADALTARNVHGYLAAALAAERGAGIEIAEDADVVQIAVLVPPHGLAS